MHLKALTVAVTAAALVAGFGHATHAKALSQTTSSSNTVTVVSGDTLSVIAARNSTTYVRIFDANQQIQNPDLIFPGESLIIPTADEQLPDRLASVPVVTPAQSEVADPAPIVSQPAPIPAAATSVSVATSGVWTSLAQCESSGNWSVNTGNGYFGGLQFTMSSWAAVGGSGMPSDASESEQIARAQMLQARQGWGAWPVCSAKLGLR